MRSESHEATAAVGAQLRKAAQEKIDLLKEAVVALRLSQYTSDWRIADEIIRVFGLDED